MKVFLLTLCLLLSTEGQKEYLNPNYKPHSATVKIALVPFFKINKAYSQAILDTLLKDNLSNLQVADLNIVSHNILTDTLLNQWVRQIEAKEYTSKELKNNPNLTLFLDKETIGYMKQKLDGADILIIPSSIDSRTVEHLNGTGNTTIYGRFRLYDLNSGEFIFDLPVENKVHYLIHKDETGKAVEVLINVFHPYYYKNFIVRNNIK